MWLDLTKLYYTHLNINILQNLHLKAQLLGLQSNFGHNPHIIIYSFIYLSPISYTKTLWLLWGQYLRRNGDIKQKLKKIN